MVRITEGSGFVRISLHVQPNARRTEPVGEHGDALKLKVQAPPVDGAANEAICEYFASQLNRPLRAVSIVLGELGRSKVIQIDGITRAELDAWIAGALK